MRISPYLVLSLLLVSSVSYGFNMRFLNDSVLTKLSKEDVVEFKRFVRTSLDTLEDKKIVVWTSSTSDNSGKFKAQFTYMSNGTTCRRTKFIVSDGVKREPFQFEICKSKDGWAIQETAAKDFKKSDWTILTASIREALESGADGHPFSWFNDTTGNSGSSVPVSSEISTDQECRKLAITVFNKRGRSSNGLYTFCKTSEQNWKRKIQLETK